MGTGGLRPLGGGFARCYLSRRTVDIPRLPESVRSMSAFRNGGFESGRLRPWELLGPARVSGLTSRVSRSGRYCLRLGNRDPLLGGIDSVAQRFDPDGVGALHLWVLSSEPLFAGPLVVELRYADGTSEVRPIPGHGLRGWEHVRVRVKRSRRLGEIRFSLGESSAYYIDDVVLA